MAHVLKLTHAGQGHAIYVLVQSLNYFHTGEGGTLVVFTGGHGTKVSETPEEILERIEKGVN